MRINVYAEELTQNTEVVEKIVEGRKFFGVRLFLKSPKQLHHSADDDDRSAITFWVPWRKGKNHHDELLRVIHELWMAAKLAESRDA